MAGEPTTWALLQAAILNWLVTDDATIDATELIGYAERRFNRVLRVPEMEESVTASVSTASIALPADFLEMKSLYIDGSSLLTLLRQVSVDELRAVYSAEDTGTPALFALQSATEMLFAPAPTTSTTYVMNYYQKIPALGASQASNWLLAAHPDLYLAQSLVEGFTMLKDEARMASWQQRADNKMSELVNLGRRKALGENRAPLRSDIPPSRATFNIFTGA